MSDIDWSKAPEGATHWTAAKDAVNPFLRKDGSEWFWFDGHGWSAYIEDGPQYAHHIAKAVPRPVSEGPLRAEEFDHLVEPDWSQAPEGATHYNSRCAYPWLRDGDIVAYFADERGWRDYGVPAGGRRAINEAVPRPTPISEGPLRAEEFDHLAQPEAHTDDLAVDAFAQAMRLRLSACRAAGKSGWDDPEQCPPQRLAEGLVRAVRAGKLVDVGNYAMMLWMRTYGRELPPSAPIAGWIGEALERREPVEWDGTGLPPVGTVCEHRSFHAGPWERVTVIAWGDNQGLSHSAIFQRDKGGWSGCAWPESFRPILTPEQRAAKERDEAVAAMLKVLESNSSMRVSDVMGALYDAGWRKTEGE